ncbi:MAG: protein O-mannosyl-transferase family [Phycisphaerae bacterium]
MTTHNTPSVECHRTFIAAATLGGLALYALTCAPGALWQDSGMFQFRVWHCDLRGELGLPLAHPLYILLAKAFACLPLGNFAYRVNLFSAVCGAATLGLAMHLLLILSRSRVGATIGTISLAVGHTFWTHAVIAEVYELYTVGLLVELTLLERFFTRRRVHWLALALLANGLNLSNHHFALLHLPAYVGVFVWAIRVGVCGFGILPVAGAAWLLGTVPYSGLVVQDILGGQPILESLKLALVGPAERARAITNFSFPIGHQCLRAVQYFAMNFPTPLALLAPLGLWWTWKDARLRWFAAVGGCLFGINFVFAFRYLVPDQFVFFMPCYVLFSLFIGLAVPCVIGRATSRTVVGIILALLPIAVYEIAPAALTRFDISIGVKRHIPFRDTHAYFIRPRKNGETSASQFARAAFEQAGPDGLLIAGSTIHNMLVYVRDVEGLGRGVTLTSGPDTTPVAPVIELSPETLAPFVERGAAYVCSSASGYVPRWIMDAYDLEPAGIIFRLRRKARRDGV